MIWKGNPMRVRAKSGNPKFDSRRRQGFLQVSRGNKAKPKPDFSKGRAMSLAESKANPIPYAKAIIRVPRPGRRKPNRSGHDRPIRSARTSGTRRTNPKNANPLRPRACLSTKHQVKRPPGSRTSSSCRRFPCGISSVSTIIIPDSRFQIVG